MSLNLDKGIIEKTYGFKLEQLNPNQNRFHAVYFVDSITGAVLVSKKYSDSSFLDNKNDDLISSFLSAINMFIRELKSDDNEEIQEINFQGSRILYERKGRLICIGISKKTNLQIERVIMREILRDFYYRFEKEINNFKGIIDPAIISYRERLENLNLNKLFKFNVKY
ncbi:MAG: hypothetical protein ACTSQJ_15555 [Promethearchaeota archaeon]